MGAISFEAPFLPEILNLSSIHPKQMSSYFNNMTRAFQWSILSLLSLGSGAVELAIKQLVKESSYLVLNGHKRMSPSCSGTLYLSQWLFRYSGSVRGVVQI